jgi:hypothetical protein
MIIFLFYLEPTVTVQLSNIGLDNFCAPFISGTEATEPIDDHRIGCWNTCWHCSNIYTLDMPSSFHQGRCNCISGLMFTLCSHLFGLECNLINSSFAAEKMLSV